MTRLTAVTILLVAGPLAAQGAGAPAAVRGLLTRADEPAARQALLVLCRAWSDTDDRRIAVGYELLAVATDRAAPVTARRVALDLLGKAIDERVTPEIADLLHDPIVALDAVDALKHIPHTDPTAALAVALEWAEGDLLVALLQALGSRRDRRASSDVVRVLEETEGVDVRRAALAALGMIEDGRTLDVVLGAAGDNRLHAGAMSAALKIARALEPAEAKAAYQAILNLARTDDAIVGALTGLTRVGDVGSLRQIESLAGHPSPVVRAAVQRAVRRLSEGEPVAGAQHPQ